MKKPSVLYFLKENQTDKRTDYKPADNVIAMSILTIQSFSRLTLTPQTTAPPYCSQAHVLKV